MVVFDMARAALALVIPGLDRFVTSDAAVIGWSARKMADAARVLGDSPKTTSTGCCSPVRGAR
jgi:hypothetical protein